MFVLAPPNIVQKHLNYCNNAPDLSAFLTKHCRISAPASTSFLGWQNHKIQDTPPKIAGTLSSAALPASAHLHLVCPRGPLKPAAWLWKNNYLLNLEINSVDSYNTMQKQQQSHNYHTNDNRTSTTWHDSQINFLEKRKRILAPHRTTCARFRSFWKLLSNYCLCWNWTVILFRWSKNCFCTCIVFLWLDLEWLKDKTVRAHLHFVD